MTDANRPTESHGAEGQNFPRPADEAPLSPAQARLREALQRSRAIPLDGSIADDEIDTWQGDRRSEAPRTDAVRDDAVNSDAVRSDAVRDGGAGSTRADLADASDASFERPRETDTSQAGATAVDARDTDYRDHAGGRTAFAPAGATRIDEAATNETRVAADVRANGRTEDALEEDIREADARAARARADYDRAGDLRNEDDYERALREDDADTTDVAPAAAPVREVDREAVKRDADTFAPLGIHNQDGPLQRPVKRSNRGFALLMAVIATLVFAALYAGLFALARVIYAPGSVFLPTFTAFIGTAPFYVAVAVFFVALLLWSILTNRGGWISYVVAGLIIGLAAFFSYHLGVAVQTFVNTNTWDIAPMLASLRAPEHLPGALIAFFAAREVITWLGGLVSLRGRKLRKLNAADRDEYEKQRAAVSE